MKSAELIEAIRNGLAVTWKHFNLHGEFALSDERMVDSMGLVLPKIHSWNWAKVGMLVRVYSENLYC